MMIEEVSAVLQALALIFAEFLSTTPDPAPDATHRASAKVAATASFDRAAASVKDQERFWTAPFVLADLQAGEVVVWGEHTGMNPGEPLEFFVIGQESGHDYESLMISYAKPSDIEVAVRKIGGKPGGGVNPDLHRFFPRGSRVVAEVEWKIDGEEKPRRMPVEQTVIHLGKAMKPLAWVFTGAPLVPSPEDPEKMVHSADAFSPNSVASAFNLINTVFDLPHQGSKTQTYGNFVRSKEADAPEAQPMLLRLRLAKVDEVPKEVDLRLRFSAAEPRLKVEGMDFTEAPVDLAELGAALGAREKEVHFLRPDFADDLILSDLITLARECLLLEQNLKHVHIEPPVEGQPFFQAFTPDPRFRQRENRPSQPLELHLSDPATPPLRGTVMELEEIWGEGRIPKVLEKRVTVETPADWRAYLKGRESTPRVLFVYAHGSLEFGQIRAWLSGVMDQFPVLFVYTVDP